MPDSINTLRLCDNVVQLGQNFSNSTRVKIFRELGQSLITETVLALNQNSVQSLIRFNAKTRLSSLAFTPRTTRLCSLMKRAFISFDYDHDSDLKVLLVGQSKHPDTDFEIADFSIKEAISYGWKDNARTRIKGCDVVIVICGEYTNMATGVSAELEIAQEEGTPYFLLYGRSDKTCVKPIAANPSDKIYRWTWDYLKALVNGAR